jgi:acyl dehydratase
MLEDIYFEDLYPGQIFESLESYWLTAKEIIGFGERYDPQPFHIDETAGQNSFFHGLAASGWLTAAIAMRQRVQSIKIYGGMIGAGVEEMRWTKPVRPGDRIRTVSEIQQTRRSATRPDYGVVRCLTTAYNQRDEVVMTSVTNFLAPLRASSPSASHY